MAIIKTTELTGNALDWAVALALGKRPSMFIFQQTGALAKEHHYSTDWVLAGPIIEREHIGLVSPANNLTMFWTANISYENNFTQFDHCPLVAAMRCYVASKLGDSVEIPDELL